MTRTLIASIVCTALVSGPVLHAADITETTFAAFVEWTDAVKAHVPGRTDDPLSYAMSLGFDRRVELDEGMPFFLSALKGRTPVADSDPKKRLVKLARDAAAGDPNLFLKRAAVLHADAAIVRAGGSRDAGELDPVARGGTGSPLFPKGFLILDDDGESKGRAPRDWNWVFARSLLDLLSPRSDHRPFLAAWYHATTAMMFRDGAYGEATYHLEHALQVLPDEPRLLFDVACLSEVDGLPIFQQTLSDEELERLRRQFAPGTGRANTIGRTFATVAALTGIPPLEIANGDAERLFRRALQLDPSLTEAHARLARLLTIRGKHADALEQAEAALAAKPDRLVAFYAHMFAGRASRALGRLEVAAEHYAQARALFPDAQSAAVGASQVALLRADVGGATAPVGRLGELAIADPDIEKDPWWGYRFGPGHDSDALLAAMWSAMGSDK
jgi:tetratricopeptide (TPR) repeat protein